MQQQLQQQVQALPSSRVQAVAQVEACPTWEAVLVLVRQLAGWVAQATASEAAANRAQAHQALSWSTFAAQSSQRLTLQERSSLARQWRAVWRQHLQAINPWRVVSLAREDS